MVEKDKGKEGLKEKKNKFSPGASVPILLINYLYHYRVCLHFFYISSLILC